MFYTRYDYEECKTEDANQVMKHLEALLVGGGFVGKTYSSGKKSYKVDKADNFSYVDPIDNSVAKNQVSSIIVKNVSSQVRFLMAYWELGYWKR